MECKLVFRWGVIWKRKMGSDDDWTIEKVNGWDIKDCDGCDGRYVIGRFEEEVCKCKGCGKWV